MWWSDRRTDVLPRLRRVVRCRWPSAGLTRRLLPAAVWRRDRSPAAAGLQPTSWRASQVHADRRPERHAAVARVGVELRNELMFDLTGGGAAARRRTSSSSSSPSTQTAGDRRHHHRAAGHPELRHRRHLHADRARDRQDGGDRPDLLARVLRHSRPAAALRRRARLRDAENRAAKVIADNIRSRLASYFVAGT